MSLLDYWKKLRNNEKAILLAQILAIPLDGLLLIYGNDTFDHADFDLSIDGTIFNTINPARTDIQQAIFGITSTAALLSAADYMGRPLNYWEALELEKIKRSPLTRDLQDLFIDEIQKYPRRGKATLFGVICGLILGTTIALLFFLSGGITVYVGLIATMAILSLVGSCGGLASRTGQVADRISWKKDNSLNRNYELSIIVSLLLCAIPLTFLMLNLLTGNIFGILTLVATAVILVATTNSGAHFIGRSLDFLSNERTLLTPFLWKMEEKNKRYNPSFWARCTNENLGTTAGFFIGLGLGIALVLLGIWMPPFLLALPFFLQAPLMVTTAISVCCAFTARVGRILDRALKTDTHHAKTLLHVLFDQPPSPRRDWNAKSTANSSDESPLLLDLASSTPPTTAPNTRTETQTITNQDTSTEIYTHKQKVWTTKNCCTHFKMPEAETVNHSLAENYLPVAAACA